MHFNFTALRTFIHENGNEYSQGVVYSIDFNEVATFLKRPHPVKCISVTDNPITVKEDKAEEVKEETKKIKKERKK